MQPLPSVVSPEFLFESWLIMSVIIVIRQDEPENKMLFPSARRSPKNNYETFDKIRLNVYDAFDIVYIDRTSVRDVSPPKS